MTTRAAERHRESVRALAGARLLVLGDVMLDDYIWGEVSRISPEAPVPIVGLTRQTSVPGGAANVARGVVALGGTVLLAGIVGDDANGARLRATLRGCGIGDDGLLVTPGRPTTTKTRIVARAQQIVRVDHEECADIPVELGEMLVEWTLANVHDADAVILSDYDKGAVSAATSAGVIAAATAAGVPMVVDPKSAGVARYAGASVITPNVLEAEQATGLRAPGDDAGVTALARRLAELLPGTNIVITRGPDGMLLLSNDGSITTAALEPREVNDVTGAGDTVVATLATALARSVELADAVRLANQAAAIAVTQVGVAAVALEDLARACG
jgi:D-beta-D-heptose 7-phosphate kinase/D-beta-D-heptose 1-phosphate adenosyltransferase